MEWKKWMAAARDAWWERQRATDLEILWPTCKAQAQTLDHAKAAFAVHAFNDKAWIRHYGHDELVRVIDAMR